MRNLFTHFGMTKSQRSGYFVLVSFIIILLGVQWYITFQYQPSQSSLTKEDYKKIATLKKEIHSNSIKRDSITLTRFNPNNIDKEDFSNLGFSAKQINIIFNYKRSIDGFKTKEDFHKCYAVSDEKFNELKAFIDLPETNSSKTKHSRKSQYSTKISRGWEPKPFYPNKATLKSWINIGLSNKQANGVLNYRKSLGGSFTNKEDLKKAYTLPANIFNRIEPYLVFDEVKTNIIHTKQNTIAVKEVHINTSTAKDLIKLGLNKSDAIGIIDCRDFKGRFNTVADLKQCPNFSQSWLNILDDIELKF